MGDKLLARWHGLYPAVGVWSGITGAGMGGRRVAGADAGGRTGMDMGESDEGMAPMAVAKDGQKKTADDGEEDGLRYTVNGYEANAKFDPRT